MNYFPSLLLLIAASCSLIVSPVMAAGPDAETRALIKELGLEESGEPLKNQSWWKKPERVYITLTGNTPEVREKELALARQVAGDVELITVTRPLSDDIIEDMEILIGRCTPEIVKQATNLRWIQDTRHGVDECITPETRDADFILTNAQHTSGPPIAEHVIAMMMMLTRGLHHFHMAQQEGNWNRDYDFPTPEIGGKTMLVVGLGGVGTEIAERADALGMRVLGLRNSSRNGPGFVEYVGLSHELYDLAGRADVIVNALPLTRETEDLFDRKFFDAVKPGAYFISIGRGESTVTEDLMAALRDGRLEGAGLDVTDPEPLPPGHELWTLPNVIITPHIAYRTDQGRWRRWLLMIENLRRYINGERLLNVVDLSLGY